MQSWHCKLADGWEVIGTCSCQPEAVTADFARCVHCLPMQQGVGRGDGHTEVSGTQRGLATPISGESGSGGISDCSQLGLESQLCSRRCFLAEIAARFA